LPADNVDQPRLAGHTTQSQPPKGHPLRQEACLHQEIGVDVPTALRKQIRKRSLALHNP
jgi:hypothetical protein